MLTNFLKLQLFWTMFHLSTKNSPNLFIFIFFKDNLTIILVSSDHVWTKMFGSGHLYKIIPNILTFILFYIIWGK